MFRCVSICAGLGFIGIRLVQSRKAVGHIGVDGIEPVHHILVNLFNDFILGFISTDAGSCFIIQALSQCSHIFADFLIRFHDTGILYRCISLAHIILGSLVFQIFLYIGDAVVQFVVFRFTSCGFGSNGISISLYLLIQADQVVPYRIVLFDIGSVFGSFIGHTICSHFTCYSHIASSGDIASRKASSC